MGGIWQDKKAHLVCYLFNKKIEGRKSLLWGHWYPCFGLLVLSALGFKAKVYPFACLLTSVILRFTSGVTPADCTE